MEDQHRKNAKTSPDSIWVCLWDKILLNILWSINSTHILRFAVPHWAFYSGCMNIPFMPLWTQSVFDLLKNHIQIFLQCSPHRNIHTQHMCICLPYNADRQLALGWALQKWCSVWTCFRKIWFHCWNALLTCYKMVACGSKHVLSMFTCSASKLRKK